MQILLTRLTAFVAVAAPFLAGAVQIQSSFRAIPANYIVQLKPGIGSATVESHRATVGDIHTRNLKKQASSRTATSGIEKTFNIGDFNGYAGSFDEATIQEISNLPEVLSVEEDFEMSTQELTTQVNATWGLGTISHRTANYTSYIYDTSAGDGTFAYVVDTGIRITHTEFEGRAIWGYNAVINTTDTDNFGHGTHVAGTIVGKTWGVAKNATVIAVKVFEGSSGSASRVIDGFNWAVNDIINRARHHVAVINLSIGGSGSTAWDSAITAAYQQGILAVVASGNYYANASDYSPSRSPEALTVGNIQSNYQRAASSNYGPVVDLFAPGTDIQSADYQSDTGYAFKSGTSMASPHVAGLVSYLRGLEGPLPAAAVAARVSELSTKDVVTDTRESQNRVAFNGNSA